MNTVARPARESLVEVASFAAPAFAVAFVSLWIAAGADLPSLRNVSIGAGKAVLGHLDWVFGVYVPTLLGFYVLVTGEQLGQGSAAGRLRRLLGGVAELSFAALLPGLVLVLVYCLSDAANIGALFVVLPATFMLGFLTVELGAFVVFDISVQLDDASRTRDQSVERLQRLKRRSRQPVTLVVTVAVATMAVLGALAVGVRGGGVWLAQWQTYVIIGTWAVFSVAVGMLATLARSKPGRLDRVLAVGGVVLVWVVLGGVASSQEASRLRPIIAGCATVACFATISTFWPIRWGPRFVVDWCLAGAGATVAARSAVRQYRRSSHRIAELRPMITSDEEVPERRFGWIRALVARRLMTSSRERT